MWKGTKVVQQLLASEVLWSMNWKRLLTTPATTLQCARGVMQWCQFIYMLLLINKSSCTK